MCFFICFVAFCLFHIGQSAQDSDSSQTALNKVDQKERSIQRYLKANIVTIEPEITTIPMEESFNYRANLDERKTDERKLKNFLNTEFNYISNPEKSEHGK